MKLKRINKKFSSIPITNLIVNPKFGSVQLAHGWNLDLWVLVRLTSLGLKISIPVSYIVYDSKFRIYPKLLAVKGWSGYAYVRVMDQFAAHFDILGDLYLSETLNSAHENPHTAITPK